MAPDRKDKYGAGIWKPVELMEQPSAREP